MTITAATIKNSGLVRALTAQNAVTLEKIDSAGVESPAGKSVADWLISSGLTDATSLAKAVATHFGYPLLDVAQFEPESLGEIDADIMQATKGLEAIILGRRNNTLFVGMADPTDLSTLQQLKFRTHLQVEPVVVEYDKLGRLLSDNQTPEADSLALENVNEVASADQQDDTLDVDDAPIVRYVQRILSEALKRQASDIHFEPYEKMYRVRYRIDGLLQETSQPPLSARAKIAARIKIMSLLNTTETRIPQDGRMRISLGPDLQKVDFRVSTLPTLFGEKIVLRLLDSTRSVLGIDQLGFNARQKKDLLDALDSPHGMLLVTGPTGSGKTVSLYTFLNVLNKETINISTVEDPAEINIPGINQVNINEKIGLTFAKALRSLLRQDPDVIMVGEIRDIETADISIKASQTGHKVLSTLHTNDAVSTIVRLKNMGVETYNIASSVNLVIAQRLVRKLCQCKSPLPEGPRGLVNAGLIKEVTQEDWTPFCAVGCEACNGTGYMGRTGIYEVLKISDAMKDLIIANASALEMEKLARSEGTLSMRESGLEKIRAGITSIDEILAATKTD